jgi:hypothetical protein
MLCVWGWPDKENRKRKKENVKIDQERKKESSEIETERKRRMQYWEKKGNNEGENMLYSTWILFV